MAEILGLGVTHWPTLCMPNEGLTGVFKTTLRAPNVDAALDEPGGEILRRLAMALEL